MLTEAQHDEFRRAGHVTVPGLFSPDQVQAAITDITEWGIAFLAELPEEQRQWYIERGDDAGVQLRKLDNPVFHRALFRSMAALPKLTAIVEQLVGTGVSVFFSQVFCKPPEVGGPKPIHQDNFYFGPDDPDATLTVWIALDAATPENGCLYYGDGSHRGGVRQHTAPADEPFNLQLPNGDSAGYVMTPAPVPPGGVSFHHGTTLHRSAANTSQKPRRAAAFHYLRNDARLIQPALAYDSGISVQIT